MISAVLFSLGLSLSSPVSLTANDVIRAGVDAMWVGLLPTK